ncbi:MAG: MBOAT family O-acyltransferase [Bacteroidota bacterium]
MLFNSFEFFIFFPIVTLVYFFLPHTYRWIWLLSASCLFYMFFIPSYILILLLTILIDYFAGIRIAQVQGNAKKRWLWFSVISTCLILGVFKYCNFFIENWNGLANLLGWNYSLSALQMILPIGLSFHTFQSMSYVIEVYRGNQQPERHFGIYSLYVMFYPQLVAGPIERPQNILHQFYQKQAYNYANVSAGLQRMLWGMVKKVVIADNLAPVVKAVYASSDIAGWHWLLLATVFFSIQIYCDFSGYSDIAIGAARVMGFRLMENFNLPYLSRNVREFWSKWHISLSSWFRDYVYIPLGGNRKGVVRTGANFLIVFALSGFWHGANWTFVVWGLIHGLLVVSSNFFSWHTERNWINVAKIFFTFSLVSVAWIFFRAENLTQALSFIEGIFTWRHQEVFLPNVFASIIGMPLIGKASLVVAFILLDKRITAIILQQKFISRGKRTVLLSLLLMSLVIFGYWGEVDFIYFQF